MNKPLTPYEYRVIRYIPDVRTGEFLNVGVLLYSSQNKFIKANFRSTYARLTKLNPKINGQQIAKKLRIIQNILNEHGTRLRSELVFNESLNIKDICESVLPTDDSSLQWSSVGAGKSMDHDKELQYLYSKLVGYADDDHSSNRRTEDDIWKSIKTDLEKRNWLRHFRMKEISADDDEMSFEHAVKNGSWHCIQPLSFDLSSPTNIREKAHRWLGQLTSVSTSEEDFKVYFLLAKPENRSLDEAYENAQSILAKSPVPYHFFNEDQKDDLLDMISPAIPDEVSSMTH